MMVYLPALALAIWTMLTLAVGGIQADALVNLDTEPVERFDNILLRPGDEARGVRIFYTEQHIAAVLTGKEIVV